MTRRRGEVREAPRQSKDSGCCCGRFKRGQILRRFSPSREKKMKAHGFTQSRMSRTPLCKDEAGLAAMCCPDHDQHFSPEALRCASPSNTAGPCWARGSVLAHAGGTDEGCDALGVLMESRGRSCGAPGDPMRGLLAMVGTWLPPTSFPSSSAQLSNRKHTCPS